MSFYKKRRGSFITAEPTGDERPVNFVVVVPR
jgi:hypothetical protein